MRIERGGAADLKALTPLLHALWPEHAPEDLAASIASDLFRPDAPGVLLVARSDSGQLAGFAEVMLRADYVNGCETSPVAFLEGIYVDPAHRRTGVARALVDAAAAWGRSRGAREFASDALIDNPESHAFHAAIGFAETERVVYFRKSLESLAA